VSDIGDFFRWALYNYNRNEITTLTTVHQTLSRMNFIWGPIFERRICDDFVIIIRFFENRAPGYVGHVTIFECSLLRAV